MVLAVFGFSGQASAQWSALPAPGQSALSTAKEPTVLAVAKNSRVLVTGLKGNKSVAFYHPDTGALLGTTGLPKEAIAVALSDDGTRAYALYDTDISVAVINTATRAIVSTWRVSGSPVEPDAGAGQGMALNAARNELLVLDKSGKRVIALSTQTGAVLRTKALAKKPELISLGGTTSVLVGLDDGQLIVLDASTLEISRTIALGEDLRALAWWQGNAGARALAVTRKQDALAIVDTTTGQIARVPLSDKAEGVEVEQQDHWAYVTAKDEDTVSLIDLFRQALTGYYTVPGPTGNLFFDAAANSGAGALYITLTKDDKLLRLDPSQASLIRKIAVQKTLQDVAVNQTTHEALAVSSDDPDFARIKLSDRSLTRLALPDKAAKVAVDPARNLAIVGDTKKRLVFVNLATSPATVYPERLTLQDDAVAMAVDAGRGLTVVGAKGEKRVEIVNNQTRTLGTGVALPAKIQAIALHAGKGIAYLVTEDKRLRLLNLDSRALGQVVNLSFETEGIAVDEGLNLAVLVTKDNDRAHLLDLNSLQWVTSLAMPRNPIAVAIQPDTHIAVVVSKDEDRISLIDLEIRSVTPEFNKVDKPTAVAVSTRYNQALIVSAEKDALTLVQLPNKVPTVNAVNPVEAYVGSPDTTLTFTGRNFTEGSVVFVGAQELPTSWVSSSQITAVMPAALLASAGTLSLKVNNPGPGGGTSGVINFPVKVRVPVLDSIVPDTTSANGQAKTVTLTGQHFIAPAHVLVNGQEIAAQVSSLTAAVATLPGSLFSTAGVLEIRLKTPGGTSNARTLTLTAPAVAPFIYTSAPATVQALGQPRDLTLSGYSFVSGAVVLVGTGSAQTQIGTSFANPQNLRFTLPASLTGQAANLILKVRNPDGQLSNEYLLPVVAPDLVVAAIAPERGEVGAIVSIFGAGFGTNPADNQVRFGGASGAVQAVVQSASMTELRVIVPAGALTGPVQVAVGSRTVTGPVFTVGTTPAEDYTFGANSAEVVLHQSATASVDIKLNSAGTQAFTGLAKLAVSGLPVGVSAVLSHPYLAAGSNATVVLTATPNAAVGSSTFTVTATGDTTNGIVTKTANVRVEVRAAATGVKGRFVDPKGNGIGGVLVRFDPPGGPGLSPIQVQSDAAGNFTLTGIPAGPTTLRMDATPAHPLYPIWPFLVTIEQGKMIVMPDWTIALPPADDKFTAINNATQDQQITDPRFPGVKITIPAGVAIVGYDGIRKSRIAIERQDPDKLPIPAPPLPTKSSYQLYFGTPMGGIPSAPIPVTLPNDLGLEAGEKAELMYFDGSPMGGEGMWKSAGTGTVSPDGLTIASDPGNGVPRFCGVCGVLSFCRPDPPPPDPTPPPCHPPGGGAGGSGGGGGAEPPVCKVANPVQLSNGQESPIATDFTLSGLVPLALTRYYNPVDAFNNRAGTVGSFGYGWGFEYDVVLLPFEGPEKRIVMPGNLKVNFIQQPNGSFINGDNFRFQGAALRRLSESHWELEMADKTVWKFQPFPGITGLIRGGPPLFLTEQRRPNGQVLNIGRLPNGRATSIGTAERQVSLSYGPHGFVSEVSDPLNRKVRYTYTSAGRIETVTNPEGGVTRYEYGSFQGDYPITASGSLPSGQTHDASCIQILNNSQDPDLGVPIKTIQYPGTTAKTVNTLGHGGRVLRQILADGSEYRFRYTVVGGCRAANPGLPVAIRTCSALNDSCEQSYERAQRGEHVFGGVISAVVVTDPKGRETTVRFTPQGTASGQTNEQGQPSSFKRDSVGRIIESTDVLGRTMKYSFDAAGNVSRMIDSLGRITDMTYDLRWNKLATVTRYLNGQAITSSNTYDPVTGNLLTSTTPEGHTTTVTYTLKGQVQTVTNPLGHVTRFDYNPAGDLIKITDPLNHAVVMDPDLAGRTTRITDPMNFVTRIERNALDQTTKIIDADLGETVLAYNAKHQLASVTDPLNQIIEQYDYDDLYRPVQRTDASSKVETTRYDAIGQADRHTDRKGQVTTSTFDEKDRPLTTTFADGSIIRRSYDAVGRLVKLVRSGAGLDETFTYRLDNADRLTELVRVTGSRTDTVNYQYDSLNRITQRTVNGEPTSYTHDRSGRLLTIQHRGQITRYTWDNANRLTEKTLPNGIKQQMVYDNAGRLTSLVYKSAGNAIIEQIDYGYDARGQRTSMTTLGVYPPARDTPIEANYNGANRLTMLTLKGVGAGNSDESYTLTYDDNGNLTEKRGQGAIAGKVTTYSWDKQNRLIGMTQTGANATTATFSYDQFGRRTSKVVDGAQVNFVYDGDQAVGEQVNGSTTSQLTGLAIDEHIARYSGQDQLVYLTDALGSIIAQTKADGTFQNRYGYSPYGQVSSDADDKGNPHQYTGRENDRTGLYYYRARYYMPSCGRFISEDPIGTKGGLNVYGYVNGDPVSMIDPSGELGIIGAVAGFGIDVALQLASNGGNWSCISWTQAGIAGALGAVGGGAIAGAFRHSVSGKKWADAAQNWSSVSRRYRRAHDVPGDHEVHHWLIERNSKIGKMVPDSIKNHPWNLNPVSRPQHAALHEMGPGARTILGAPEWAKAAGASAGVGMSADLATPSGGGGCD